MNAQLKSVSIIRTVGQGTSKRFAQRALVSATAFVLAVAVIAMSQSFTHHSSVIIPHPVQTMKQIRFLEQNTTTLPDATSLDVAPVAASSSQQRFLEANTIMLPNAVNLDVASPIVSISRQRFLENNTELGMDAATTIPVYPYSEAVTPSRGPR